MFRLELVDTLVTNTNIMGFGLIPLSGDHRGLSVKNQNKHDIDPNKGGLDIQVIFFLTTI